MKILTDLMPGDVRVEMHEGWHDHATVVYSRQNVLWFFLHRLLPQVFGASSGFMLNDIAAAVGTYLVRRQYDLIVMSPKMGLYFALLQSLFSKQARPKTVFFHFWVPDKAPGFLNSIREFLRRRALKYTELIIVPSSSEIRIYAKRFLLPKRKFLHIPYHVNPRAWQGDRVEGDYVLSAGSSARDYWTFLEAAKAFPSQKFVLISDKRSIENLCIPLNVELHISISYQRYLQKLRHSRIVVIPLQNIRRSAGQRVILEAMAMGKAIIASKTPGVLDYIKHGETGLLVSPESVSGLIKALESLFSNGHLVRELGERARRIAEQRFVFDDIMSQLISTLYKIYESDGPDFQLEF
ncbi:MAG: glycosyltransferase family 4 protein [Deltaproteobacteria bacterium]|nr:glycosyltransferase family 4 protein [Deltaproteobacteria bacterium]